MINIIIQKIEILNFGPYHGQHTIEFTNKGLGIHIIRGGTGQGKTSIQRAILWGLYGKVIDRQGNDIRPTSLLNHTAKRDDDYKFTVQILFEHEGEQWNIVRSTKSNRHQDRKYEDGMKIEVYKKGRVEQDPEHQIQRILPSTVSRFYFFDGEMLRDYEELLEGEGRAMTMLKDSIERVLGVPFFKTARSDLDKIKKKFEMERARIMRQLGGADLEELAEIQQELEKDLEDIEKSIEKIEGQKEKIEAIIAEDKRKLADMKEVQEMATERLSIEMELEKWKAKKETKELERGNLVEKIYKNILSPIAQNLIKQLDIQAKQSLDRYNKKQRALEKVENLKKGISESKCSQCGNILNPKKLKEFEDELRETMVLIKELTEIPEPNLSYEKSKTALEKMIGSVITEEDIRKVEDKMLEYEYEIQRLYSELEKIQSQLEGVDAEEPRNLEIKIRQNEKESGRLGGLIEEKTDGRLVLLKEKNELDIRIDSIPQKQLQKLNEQIKYIEQLKSTFDNAVSIFRDEQKERVESMATDIFRQIRSKEEFDHLQINDQYGLSVITKHDTVLNRSEWRSSGEEQLVALSLIGALNRCARAEAPIFMDTPFGRLDMLHGERVLKFLPGMSEQLVLLVTDREFREGDEAHLKGNIKTDLTLKYKNEKEGSIILPTTGVS